MQVVERPGSKVSVPVGVSMGGLRWSFEVEIFILYGFLLQLILFDLVSFGFVYASEQNEENMDVMSII